MTTEAKVSCWKHSYKDYNQDFLCKYRYRPRDHNGKSFQKFRSVRQVTSCFALNFFRCVVEDEYLPKIVLKDVEV